MKPFSRQSLAATALAILVGTAHAQTDSEISVPLSDPSRQVVLEVSARGGNVTVTGYDGNEVLVTPFQGTARIEPLGINTNRQGLRRIPNTSLGLSVEEADNTVSVQINTVSEESGVTISVPRNTSVKASTFRDGEIVVDGVTGEHELSNMHGGITATDISGSVIVNSTNGDVSVSMLELTPDKAMSFTTFNGDLEVRLPASLSADLHITTNRGDIFTDFDVDVQPQETIVERSQDGGRFQVRMESEVRAIVGGGGPEMRFKTFNGDIVIRSR